MIYASLILGLVSSLHCIGMCGPIALSLGLGTEARVNLYFKNITYQLGRVTTYTFFGLIVGVFGVGIQWVIPQQIVSILVGVFILATLLFSGGKISNNINPIFLNKFLVTIKLKLGKLLGTKSYNSLFFIGLLNGFLPCGPVYIALTAAIANNTIGQSIAFMFLYGLGTIPLMFLTVLIGNKLSNEFRNKLFKAYPYILGILAILFILRGLELGIPYVSPANEALQLSPKKNCH